MFPRSQKRAASFATGGRMQTSPNQCGWPRGRSPSRARRQPVGSAQNGFQHRNRQLKEVSKQKFVTSYFTAVVEAGLGNKDQALEWLEKSYRERVGLLAFLKVDPWFDELHSEPRFQDLLRRIGL